MRLTLAEPSYLKESINVISDLVNEGRFKITPNAVELVAMDPANVAMVVFKLLSSAFTEYDVNKEVEICIDLNNLKQMLRRAGQNDVLTLEMEDNKLKMTLKGNSTRTFYLPLIDLEEKEQRIPDLKFPVTIKTNSSVLNQAIEDADIVAESASFMAEPKKFSLHAQGDLSQARIELKDSEETKIKMDGSDKIKSKYSIEYLKKMMGASKISENVTLQFNTDYPLRLEYKTVDKVMLSFILAPRVDND